MTPMPDLGFVKVSSWHQLPFSCLFWHQHVLGPVVHDLLSGEGWIATGRKKHPVSSERCGDDSFS